MPSPAQADAFELPVAEKLPDSIRGEPRIRGSLAHRQEGTESVQGCCRNPPLPAASRSDAPQIPSVEELSDSELRKARTRGTLSNGKKVGHSVSPQWFQQRDAIGFRGRRASLAAELLPTWPGSHEGRALSGVPESCQSAQIGPATKRAAGPHAHATIRAGQGKAQPGLTRGTSGQTHGELADGAGTTLFGQQNNLFNTLATRSQVGVATIPRRLRFIYSLRCPYHVLPQGPRWCASGGQWRTKLVCEFPGLGVARLALSKRWLRILVQALVQIFALSVIR